MPYVNSLWSTSMTTTDVIGEVDGRRLRRAQNRDAVLDALVDLFEDGNLQPSSTEIAERAGLSPRSLFRYFDDVDDLNRAAIERQQARAMPLLDIALAAHHSLPDRIAHVVERRCRLYETLAPTARAARTSAHRHELIARKLRSFRAHLRGQLRTLFEPELRDTALLPALDALLSFESYELLRHDQRLSRPKVEVALVAALTALLGGDR